VKVEATQDFPFKGKPVKRGDVLDLEERHALAVVDQGVAKIVSPKKEK